MLPFISNQLFDPSAAFGRGGPLVLEIGFGMGDATAKIAQARPVDNFLCCEVHEPGVGALLDGVHIFFPDPWHTTKHNKRRLIQPALVAKLAARLKPGGYLHCATDWEPYPQQMLEVLAAEPTLQNASTAPGLTGYAPKPDYRPLTKFENQRLCSHHLALHVELRLQPHLQVVAAQGLAQVGLNRS